MSQQTQSETKCEMLVFLSEISLLKALKMRYVIWSTENRQEIACFKIAYQNVYENIISGGCVSHFWLSTKIS